MKLIIIDIEDFNLSVEGEHKIIQPMQKLYPCIGWEHRRAIDELVLPFDINICGGVHNAA